MSDYRHPWTPEEFSKLMHPWDATDRMPILERYERNYKRETLENFSPEEAEVLGAILERLIPQREGVNLVGFMDEYLHHPLGRGDKQPGMPDEGEVIKAGLHGVLEFAQTHYGNRFCQLDPAVQDTVLRLVQEGNAKGGVFDQIPSDYFFQRLYNKALHGYFAHPSVWMRIGFMGASYPEGYRWFGRGQVRARRDRHIGWEVM